MHLALFCICVVCLSFLKFHSTTLDVGLNFYIDKALQACQPSLYDLHSVHLRNATEGNIAPNGKDVSLAKDREKRSRFSRRIHSDMMESLTEHRDMRSRDGRRIHSDMMGSLMSYIQCFNSYWEQCKKPHPIVSSQRHASILHRPCYYGDHSLFRDDFLSISVNKIFQINLTFLYFYLNYYDPGCESHHMNVSKVHSNLSCKNHLKN